LDQLNETENAVVAIRREINKMKSKAKVAHANFPLWASWIPGQFDNGRLVAGIRVRQKSRYNVVSTQPFQMERWWWPLLFF
jgi:hypothetical protein